MCISWVKSLGAREKIIRKIGSLRRPLKGKRSWNESSGIKRLTWGKNSNIIRNEKYVKDLKRKKSVNWRVKVKFENWLNQNQKSYLFKFYSNIIINLKW